MRTRVILGWMPVLAPTIGLAGTARMESSDDQSVTRGHSHLTTAACTLALLVLGSAGTASEGVLDVTCTPPSSQNDTFTPPLTLAPQNVTVGIKAQYGPCVSLSNPALTCGSTNVTALCRD